MLFKIIILTTTCGAHDKMYIAAVATSSGSRVGNDASASSEYVLYDTINSVATSPGLIPWNFK